METKDIQANAAGVRPDYTAEILAVLRSGGAPKSIMR